MKVLEIVINIAIAIVKRAKTINRAIKIKIFRLKVKYLYSRSKLKIYAAHT